MKDELDRQILDVILKDRYVEHASLTIAKWEHESIQLSVYTKDGKEYHCVYKCIPEYLNTISSFNFFLTWWLNTKENL